MIESLMLLYPFALYGVAMALAVAELIVPARRQSEPVSRRWLTNIGLFVLAAVVLRIFIPVSIIVVAEAAMTSGHGVIQFVGGQFAGVPGWIAVVSGVLLLDLWKYAEHRLEHAVPLLWRLHLVHHSDVNADFTTTERHHPLETVVSVGATMAVIYGLGIPPLAVAIYLLSTTPISLISHANIRLSDRLDRWLRWIVVTPGVHVIHHSAARHETDSNFCMLLTVWDRIFGTYRSSTATETAERVIGLEFFRDARSARLDQVLRMPFLGPTAHHHSIRAGSESGTPLVP